MKTGVVQLNGMTVSGLTESQITELLTEYAMRNEEASARQYGKAIRGKGFLGSHWKFVRGVGGEDYWEHKTGKLIRSSKNW